jgi:hypothetical protein
MKHKKKRLTFGAAPARLIWLCPSEKCVFFLLKIHDMDLAFDDMHA